MKSHEENYQKYVKILEEELVPAMGCTEPIALAYAAAKAREVLGCMPDRVYVEASGSIIKNVKSVIVPNTDFLKGIPAAAAAGTLAACFLGAKHIGNLFHPSHPLFIYHIDYFYFIVADLSHICHL